LEDILYQWNEDESEEQSNTQHLNRDAESIHSEADLEPSVRSENGNVTANARSIGNVAEWSSRSGVVWNLNHLSQRACLFSSTRNANQTKKREK
jgi:hypothetical protein